MDARDTIKFFGLNNLSIEQGIRDIEESFSVDLGHKSSISGGDASIDSTYYPQFPQRVGDAYPVVGSWPGS